MHKCASSLPRLGGRALSTPDGRRPTYPIMERVEDGNSGVEEGDERTGAIDMNEERLEEVVV